MRSQWYHAWCERESGLCALDVRPGVLLTFSLIQNAAPLTIGLAVVAGVFAEGPFSGGSMNPARSIGAAFAFWKFNHILIYIIATMCGGIAAGMCYDKLYLEDVQPAEIEDRDEGDYEGA